MATTSEDQAVVDFLTSSRDKISDFIKIHDSDPRLKDLLNTSREIMECVNDVSNFLNPCFSPNSEVSIKKYEDCVFINRDVGSENEIAELLQQIQNESSEFLTFLENLHVTFNSLNLVLNPSDSSSDSGSNTLSKSRILELYNENKKLANEIDRLNTEIIANDSKLSELESTKKLCEKELLMYDKLLKSSQDLNNREAQEKLMIYDKLLKYLEPNSV
ncbi:uncharacterized protein TA14875 [Theileria annulata]|uniref:Uncharacterized protein n=1 Tax=Theileria annulata TaxID=5874 RepID=Q4UF99_THEAN|nr:uncharacterized protein TA14875 [Theileria annulata]CAI74240.1 hypothetical protein TA14875 [Theileria annulata]|eukprot:XP_951972.1 hypothetical protein TA14875 [Theileria annulata]